MVSPYLYVLRRFGIIIFALPLVLLWLALPPLHGLRQLQHQFNVYSYPASFTPPIYLNEIGPYQNDQTDQTNQTNPPLPDYSPSPFAYVFYATEPEYACSVLVNIERLNSNFATRNRIIILVKPDLPPKYLTAFTSQNATVIPYEPPPLAGDGGTYYQDVLLKLVAFRLHHYIPSLKRILVLDADQIILQSIDHVFHLPAVDLAAPRAYWLEDGFTSAFLLISLSDRVWNGISRGLDTIPPNTFDMDLVNEIFRKTLLVLPGDYATLNSHWETNDAPSWWQGKVPPQTTFPPHPPPIPPLILPKNSSRDDAVRMQLVDDHADRVARREKAIEHAEAEERRKRLGVTLENVYQDVKILHFTALGKPWTWPVELVEQQRPLAHWLFKKQFRNWREAAKRVCPSWVEADV